jgi:hypothetical protein
MILATPTMQFSPGLPLSTGDIKSSVIRGSVQTSSSLFLSYLCSARPLYPFRYAPSFSCVPFVRTIRSSDPFPASLISPDWALVRMPSLFLCSSLLACVSSLAIRPLSSCNFVPWRAVDFQSVESLRVSRQPFPFFLRSRFLS